MKPHGVSLLVISLTMSQLVCAQETKSITKSAGKPAVKQQTAKKEEKVSISGQVFVVTKGRDNIKMALVEVAAIPEKDVSPEYLRVVADRKLTHL